MSIERLMPPTTTTERETLRGYLDFQRATLALKCDGLDDEQLRQQASPPSTLSLLGLLRHMAEVERVWFRLVVNREDVPRVWSDTGDFQAAFNTDGATAHEAYAAWEREIEHARRIEATVDSLDNVYRYERRDMDISLRAVMMHMIGEYARHNGHADLLREAVDGTVGP
ncbi:DinB family protein [Actinokineospora auranticolor]|nr:DinB family protein [Actinokineospora auranticolor]